MLISFIVVCYNQEKYVIECLESIKYQVNNYAKTCECELIVADDGSTDCTTMNVRRWVNDNSSIFYKVKLIFAEENRGTCRNFASAFRACEGEFFLSIAADDLFSPTNALELIQTLKRNEIMFIPPYVIKDGVVLRTHESYLYNTTYALYKNKKFKRESKYKCPIVNGSLLDKNIISDEVLDFSTKYHYLDDLVRYGVIFEQNEDIHVSYKNLPVLIYRLSEVQVTCPSGPYRNGCIEDYSNWARYVLSKEKNILIRLRIQGELQSLREPRLKRKFWRVQNWGKYCDKIYIILTSIFTRKYRKSIVQKIDEYELQTYVDTLKEYARKYG